MPRLGKLKLRMKYLGHPEPLRASPPASVQARLDALPRQQRARVTKAIRGQ